MKNKLMMLAALLMATPMFAQAQGGQTGNGPLLGVAFAMAIASGLCALGQGRAIAAAAEGVARNPGAGGQIRTLLVLGLAFIESLALFTLVVVLR